MKRSKPQRDKLLALYGQLHDRLAVVIQDPRTRMPEMDHEWIQNRLALISAEWEVLGSIEGSGAIIINFDKQP